MAPAVDPRLRRAIDGNVAWYSDIFALHGIASRLEHGLWRSLAAPPPLHSDAVVVEPGVTLDRVMAALAGRDHAGFKDSFSLLDASGSGMEVLFSATWIHRAADRRAGSPPPDWSTVTTAAELATWTAGQAAPAGVARHISWAWSASPPIVTIASSGLRRATASSQRWR